MVSARDTKRVRDGHLARKNRATGGSQVRLTPLPPSPRIRLLRKLITVLLALAQAAMSFFVRIGSTDLTAFCHDGLLYNTRQLMDHLSQSITRSRRVSQAHHTFARSVLNCHNAEWSLLVGYEHLVVSHQKYGNLWD